LNVYSSGSSSLPFGWIDTPINGTAGIAGAIPVTGWVLDDVGIESIKIYRHPVPGDNTENLVYIGDAMLVEGARPDVEQAYPNYPQNYQAGWGYMMLTNFLPGYGNGSYTIQVHATDKDTESHESVLGMRTITCDNANAVKPFGAIDTPTQGGMESGQIINAGWVLTPLPNKIPEDGSTLYVWVDGVNLGHPVYNQYRNDIATLFPGYANSNGAVGNFYLDTTTYTNGVHTIAWSATDNAGNSDGIGSRFFTITNTGGSAHKTDAFLVSQSSLSVNSINHIPSYRPQVKVKRGYEPLTRPKTHIPGPDGIYRIKIRELERLELYLGKGLTAGYSLVGDQLRSLPVGSTLDIEKGILFWTPGPGFYGEYNLVFVADGLDRNARMLEILIHIEPKFDPSH